jgi:hypothetical protein
VVNKTSQDKGAVGLHPPGPKSSDFQNVLDRGQESEEEDVAGEGTLGVEEDAVANIARQIEGEISRYTTLGALYLPMTMPR